MSVTWQCGVTVFDARTAGLVGFLRAPFKVLFSSYIRNGPEYFVAGWQSSPAAFPGSIAPFESFPRRLANGPFQKPWRRALLFTAARWIPDQTLLLKMANHSLKPSQTAILANSGRHYFWKFHAVRNSTQYTQSLQASQIWPALSWLLVPRLSNQRSRDTGTFGQNCNMHVSNWSKSLSRVVGGSNSPRPLLLIHRPRKKLSLKQHNPWD